MNRFQKLVKASGWSQAEVARRLLVTPGAVSQLCSGVTRPRPATLELLRLVIEKDKSDALKLRGDTAKPGLEPWATNLLNPLRHLAKADRERLLTTFRDLIKTVAAAARSDDPASREAARTR